MFSFIHAADLHLDSPMRGLSRHEGAPVEEIRGATRRAVENLVELAIHKRVNFVLISGDLYDGDQRDYGTALFFNQQMLRLKKEGIRVYAITGNHDAEAVITKSLSPPENVHFFSTKKSASERHPGLPVTLHGQGFATTKVPENLAENYPEAVPEHFNIGLLHTSLAGNAQHDTYAPCSPKELQQKGYHYWALGHIHQPEVIRQSPWIAYSGNTQGRSVKELGERGCYLVTVNDALEVTDHRFHPLDVVRWAHLEIDLTDLAEEALPGEVSSALASALNEVGERLLAVRITLTGATELHGALHSQYARWQAECVSLAAEIDPGQIWVEQLKLRTSPVLRPEVLAERDELTSMVLDSLSDFDFSQVPPEVNVLEKKLLAAGIDLPESATTREEISALVLQSISLSGTQ